MTCHHLRRGAGPWAANKQRVAHLVLGLFQGQRLLGRLALARQLRLGGGRRQRALVRGARGLLLALLGAARDGAAQRQVLHAHGVLLLLLLELELHARADGAVAQLLRKQCVGAVVGVSRRCCGCGHDAGLRPFCPLPARTSHAPAARRWRCSRGTPPWTPCSQWRRRGW